MGITRIELSEAMGASERRAASHALSLVPALPTGLTVSSPEYVEAEMAMEASILGGPQGTFAYLPPEEVVPDSVEEKVPHPFDLKVLEDTTDENGERKIKYAVLNPEFNLFFTYDDGSPRDWLETAQVFPSEGIVNPIDIRLVLYYTKDEIKNADGEVEKVKYLFDRAEVHEGNSITATGEHRREFTLYKFDPTTHKVTCDYRHAFININKEPMSSGGGGGGEITVDPDAIVGISMDYVTDTGEHQYSIRLTRGRLKIDDGVLKVVQDDKLTQYIKTTPLSKELKYFAEADYGTPNME